HLEEAAVGIDLLAEIVQGQIRDAGDPEAPGDARAVPGLAVADGAIDVEGLFAAAKEGTDILARESEFFRHAVGVVALDATGFVVAGAATEFGFRNAADLAGAFRVETE